MVLVAPTDRVLLAKAQHGQRLVAISRGIVHVSRIVPTISVDRVQPEPREKGYGTQWEQEGRQAKSREPTRGVRNCSTTSIGVRVT